MNVDFKSVPKRMKLAVCNYTLIYVRCSSLEPLPKATYHIQPGAYENGFWILQNSWSRQLCLRTRFCRNMKRQSGQGSDPGQTLGQQGLTSSIPNHCSQEVATANCWHPFFPTSLWPMMYPDIHQLAIHSQHQCLLRAPKLRCWEPEELD
ncbi:hypothetical protein FIBSPDRAFT_358719 [Athelia psychrophila]|uniref:Uncharacterized protein n=1 Tax=Athelia psychrophila TaxID=1759441 RepID=A0A166PKS6_9AGAM|nr:hypothetical protein FIBSPDRAFT_358719 [Fibularhizoctonia sp. CBS 109695]